MDAVTGWDRIDRQRETLAALLTSLTTDELATPSLCRGWTVRDVGAHLAVAALTPVPEILRCLVGARGSFDGMIDLATRRRAGRRTDEQIVADLRGLVGNRRLAPSTSWRDALIDVLVHGEDLGRPIGRAPAMPVDAATEALEWAWQRGFPFHARKRFANRTVIATDADWRRGDGPELRAPVAVLLLTATGRPS